MAPSPFESIFLNPSMTCCSEEKFDATFFKIEPALGIIIAINSEKLMPPDWSLSPSAKIASTSAPEKFFIMLLSSSLVM